MERNTQSLLAANTPDRSDYSVRYKEILEKIEAQNINETCPLCGGKLVLRTAKCGENSGKKFYGCSNYAKLKCKYTRDFDITNNPEKYLQGNTHIETKEEREKRWENDWLD